MRILKFSIILTLPLIVIFLAFENKIDGCIKGKGKIQTQIRKVPKFKSIEIENYFNVVVEKSDTIQVIVKERESLINHIKTEVEDEVLKIYFDVNCFKHSKNEVIIQVPDIESIKLKSFNDLTVRGKFPHKEVRIEAQSYNDIALENWQSSFLYCNIGSFNDLELAIDGKILKLDILGKSYNNVELKKGKAETVNIELGSFCDVKSTDFKIDLLSIDIGSYSDATLTASRLGKLRNGSFTTLQIDIE